MRLLNTTTLEFKEFFDPPFSYAILSHCWEKSEASYQTYMERKDDDDSPGIRKIRGFCEFARTRQPTHEYVWIDTCCINKQDSSELMESINSMYWWYHDAQVCYVYMRDLPSKGNAHKQERDDAFSNSVWFQRGWTLQELLAPPKVKFCDQEWQIYGDKVRLAGKIEDITGITTPFLKGTHPPQAASVAMRMSWASKRKTTKPEDQAYCMLGLFGVAMPLLYGEGQKAFMRLQLEIIKRSDDESIFAWKDDISSWGMLARSPAAFEQSGNIVKFELSPEQRMPYEMTNKGLRFPSASDTTAKNMVDPSTMVPMGYNTHTVVLGCFRTNATGLPTDYDMAEEMWENDSLTIKLERCGPLWMRVDCGDLETISNRGRPRRENGTYCGQGVQRTYFVEQPDPQECVLCNSPSS